jgi:hypothetical protein
MKIRYCKPKEYYLDNKQLTEKKTKHKDNSETHNSLSTSQYNHQKYNQC